MSRGFDTAVRDSQNWWWTCNVKRLCCMNVQLLGNVEKDVKIPAGWTLSCCTKRNKKLSLYIPPLLGYRCGSHLWRLRTKVDNEQGLHRAVQCCILI